MDSIGTRVARYGCNCGKEAGQALSEWRTHPESRAVRRAFASALILCLILWPASADLSDSEPIVSYALPADIMRVEFADETWVYRLYEDGRVEKIISKERYALDTRGEPREEVRCMSDGTLYA